MNRWNTRTSFYSRHSRRFPSFSFEELNKLMKERARATYAARYIRKALEKQPLLEVTKLGTSLREQFYSNAWWKTWKTQWELASNQSRRTFYGLGPCNQVPRWTRRACSRVTLPTKDDLKVWREDPAADSDSDLEDQEEQKQEQTFDEKIAAFREQYKAGTQKKLSKKNRNLQSKDSPANQFSVRQPPLPKDPEAWKATVIPSSDEGEYHPYSDIAMRAIALLIQQLRMTTVQ